MRFRCRAFSAIALLVLLVSGAAATAAPRSPAITFYFGLGRPEAAARAALYAVEQPGSPSYRHFLSARQLTARYGASRQTKAAFVRAVRKHGLSARIDASGVFARVTGTVSEFDRVFKVQIQTGFNNDENGDFWVLKRNARLHLPADMQSLVQDVVPSYTRAAAVPTALAADRSRAVAWPARAAPPRRTGAWTRGCRKAKATGAFSFAQVRHAYGIDQLGRGLGASVALLNVAEGVSAQDIADNARCFGYPRLRRARC